MRISTSPPGQLSEPVSYDVVMLLGVEERLAMFQTLTPANRAAIVREQIVRWRRVNTPRLTGDQLHFLNELPGLIRAELYDPAHPARRPAHGRHEAG